MMGLSLSDKNFILTVTDPDSGSTMADFLITEEELNLILERVKSGKRAIKR